MVDTPEKSWGEVLQSHVRKRTELSWKPDEQEPVKYVTRYEVSRKEREFDPVLQRYRDQGREQDFSSREQVKTVHKLNRARVQQLNKAQSYDVINHRVILPGTHVDEKGKIFPKGQAGGAEEKPRTKTQSSQQSRAGYNIISNVDLSSHHYDHPSRRPSNPEHPRPRQSTFKQSLKTEFDIISNRYRDRHDEKVKIDLESQKRQAASKYWETHDFDPIACRFYAPEKEERFTNKRQDLERTHGQDFNKRLPPSIRNSDGMGCNIISMQSPADERTRELNSGATNQTTTTTSHLSTKSTMERTQQERAITLQRMSHARNANRCLPNRHEETHGYVHGHDIINKKPFVGRGSIDKPKLRENPQRQNLWQRLEKQQFVRRGSSNQETDQEANSIRTGGFS